MPKARVKVRLTAKLLPETHTARSIVELWAVYRDYGEDEIEIGENPDRSLKIFCAKGQAKRAAAAMGGDWKAGSVWMIDKGIINT